MIEQQSAGDELVSRQTHPGFAVIRIHSKSINDARTREDIEDVCLAGFTITKVFGSKAEADSDASRLNQLQGDDDIFYTVQHTRVVD